MNKNPANFVPLTPISFLHRTADVYGQNTSVIYENRIYTWSESRERCVRIASSLNSHGVMPGDTVSSLHLILQKCLNLTFQFQWLVPF